MQVEQVQSVGRGLWHIREFGDQRAAAPCLAGVASRRAAGPRTCGARRAVPPSSARSRLGRSTTSEVDVALDDPAHGVGREVGRRTVAVVARAHASPGSFGRVRTTSAVHGSLDPALRRGLRAMRARAPRSVRRAGRGAAPAAAPSGSGRTVTSSASAGATGVRLDDVVASSVRWPTHSVCVPWQWGASV